MKVHKLIITGISQGYLLCDKYHKIANPFKDWDDRWKNVTCKNCLRRKKK
jgi:hypothetical protein